eukprot:1160915-Pelagomonas_calceolata.AAC.23
MPRQLKTCHGAHHTSLKFLSADALHWRPGKGGPDALPALHATHGAVRGPTPFAFDAPSLKSYPHKPLVWWWCP